MNKYGLFAAIVLSASISSPATADVVTFRSTGVIAQTAEYSFGEDGIGLFGAPGSSLLGAGFILTTTFDTDQNHRTDIYDWYGYTSGNAPFDVSITINGRTHAYHVDNTVILHATVFGVLSAIGRGPDELYFEGAGPDAAGRFVSAAHNARSYTTPFIGATADFGTSAQFAPGTADYGRSHFAVYGADGISTRFQTFSLNSMEVNPAPLDLPEPGAWALWMAAAFGLLLARAKFSLGSPRR